jgi:hypothetical protein
MTDVAVRFNQLNLSDCLLLYVHVDPAEPYDEVSLGLSLISGPHADQWKPAVLRFIGCAAVRMHMDMWAKSVCAHNIGGSEAESVAGDASELLTSLNDFRERDQPVASLVTFRIDLVSPSGELAIVARDFALVES